MEKMNNDDTMVSSRTGVLRAKTCSFGDQCADVITFVLGFDAYSVIRALFALSYSLDCLVLGTLVYCRIGMAAVDINLHLNMGLYTIGTLVCLRELYVN